jgi:CBS-domain-containing membrane protein
MKTSQQNLFLLTAEDIMTRDVLTVPRSMSLHAAAHLLDQDHISGAPVVDEEGCCVGVISTTDFVRWAEQGGHPERPRHAVEAGYCADWGVLQLSELPGEEVGCFMTTDPVMAESDTPLVELARQMLEAHIHRVIIVDGACHPLGVVSSTDILAALIKAEPRA